MTAAALALIHAQAFTMPRPWSEAEIAGLLDNPLCFVLTEPDGFLLGRVVAGEAELLTVAVCPETQGKGIGRRLVQGFLTEAARRGADSAFLEVAETNLAARVLWEFPPKLAYSFCRRMLLKNYIYDFSLESLYLIAAFLFLAVGIGYGGWNWIAFSRLGEAAPTGTVVIPAISLQGSSTRLDA